MRSRRGAALCYGTRPQVIKAAVLARALGERWELRTVDTGQHYDYELNALLYEQLGVQRPDAFLNVGSGDHASQTGAVMARAAALFGEWRPAFVVVVGDTNSTLGCALAAAKMRIPVVHVEAGLRSPDALMAEEINRRAVDAIAAVLCAPSGVACERLRAQRPDASVAFTGDVARDVLERARCTGAAAGGATLPESVSDAVAGGDYVFATLHRAELTDDPALLAAAVGALRALGRPVVFAAHPRTVSAAARGGVCLTSDDSLRVTPPLGYFESLALTQGAAAVATDSGGVQREAYWLGTPCVTVRTDTEWEETVALGANRLVAPREVGRALAPAIAGAIDSRAAGWDRDAYGDGSAAAAVVAQIAAWESA